MRYLSAKRNSPAFAGLLSLSKKAIGLFRQKSCMTDRTRFLAKKVALSVMRSVISEVHAPGNDMIGFYSVICG